jgi:hypothetical protein
MTSCAEVKRRPMSEPEIAIRGRWRHRAILPGTWIWEWSHTRAMPWEFRLAFAQVAWRDYLSPSAHPCSLPDEVGE